MNVYLFEGWWLHRRYRTYFYNQNRGRIYQRIHQRIPTAAYSPTRGRENARRTSTILIVRQLEKGGGTASHEDPSTNGWALRSIRYWIISRWTTKRMCRDRPANEYSRRKKAKYPFYDPSGLGRAGERSFLSAGNWSRSTRLQPDILQI